MFEGTEKKAQITIEPNTVSLLTDFNDEFWHMLVSHAGASILSQVENNDCRAYILSESTLVVWPDHFLIMTCGTTQLIAAIEFFIRSQQQGTIRSVIYQRKNEYFSQCQPSCFNQDVAQISQYTQGRSYFCGDINGHYNQLFLSTLTSVNQFESYEFLAYKMSKQASNFLTQPGLTETDILNFLQISPFLDKFTIDQHCFEPFGYSLNAIAAHRYVTIHITPQHNSSYLSVVANIDLKPIINPLINVIQPAAFDLLKIGEVPQCFSGLNLSSKYLNYNQEQCQLINQQQLYYLNYRKTS